MMVSSTDDVVSNFQSIEEAKKLWARRRPAMINPSDIAITSFEQMSDFDCNSSN
jgi:hypothetical protein